MQALELKSSSSSEEDVEEAAAAAARQQLAQVKMQEQQQQQHSADVQVDDDDAQEAAGEEEDDPSGPLTVSAFLRACSIHFARRVSASRQSSINGFVERTSGHNLILFILQTCMSLFCHSHLTVFFAILACFFDRSPSLRRWSPGQRADRARDAAALRGRAHRARLVGASVRALAAGHRGPAREYRGCRRVLQAAAARGHADGEWWLFLIRHLHL